VGTKAPRPNHDHKWDDYHDPTAGIGGAPPARSALTLRLILAGFGVVVCALGALSAAVAGRSGFAVVLAVLAAVAAIDFVVVVHRKRRGEPG